MKRVLVTGGAGYIGSHTCVELVASGRMPVIFDNFSNSRREVVNRICELANRDIPAVRGDVRDGDAIRRALEEYDCSSVIHFAGLKSVGASNEQAIEYYENNVVGTHCLLREMKEAGVSQLVFSSSATVYGQPNFLPITEEHPLRTTNPYGQTKLICEYMLDDVANSKEIPDVVILRYFNPIGAHPSGRIGEAPNGVPDNLLPYIAQVAVGVRDKLHVFGGDYDTADGTGVRDFIHVVDLAHAHVKALDRMEQQGGMLKINIGTGAGYSVLQMVKAFEDACGRKIPYVFQDRRQGDVAQCYADPALAFDSLGWRAKFDIEDMCRDHWRWQNTNPNGYE